MEGVKQYEESKIYYTLAFLNSKAAESCFSFIAPTMNLTAGNMNRLPVTKYTKQLAEMKIYDEAIAHVANQRIEIDLDDGVKVNYAKFQGVEVAQEGKKALKVDLLAKI